MQTLWRVANLCLLVTCVLCLHGCAKSDPAPPESALTQVLEMWVAGQSDEAVAALLAIDWSDPEQVPKAPLLTAEQDLSGLSDEERNRFNSTAIEFAGAARELASHALARGGGRDAVHNLGKALAHPEGLFPLKSVGIVITNMAGTGD